MIKQNFHLMGGCTCNRWLSCCFAYYQHWKLTHHSNPHWISFLMHQNPPCLMTIEYCGLKNEEDIFLKNQLDVEWALVTKPTEDILCKQVFHSYNVKKSTRKDMVTLLGKQVLVPKTKHGDNIDSRVANYILKDKLKLTSIDSSIAMLNSKRHSHWQEILILDRNFRPSSCRVKEQMQPIPLFLLLKKKRYISKTDKRNDNIRICGAIFPAKECIWLGGKRFPLS